VISGGRRGDNFVRHMGDGITVDVRRTLLAMPGPPPPMAIAVRMNVLVASLLDTEYHKILGILSGNFAEAPDLPPEIFALHTRRLAEQRAAAAAAAVAAGGAAAVAAARAAKQAPPGGGVGSAAPTAPHAGPARPAITDETAGKEAGGGGAAAGTGDQGGEGQGHEQQEEGDLEGESSEADEGEEEGGAAGVGVRFEEELTAPLPTARRRRRRLERADLISPELRKAPPSAAPLLATVSPTKNGRGGTSPGEGAAAALGTLASVDGGEADSAFEAALDALADEPAGGEAGGPGVLERLRQAVTNFSLANAALLTLLDDAVSMTCSVAIGSAQLLLSTEQPDGQQAFPLGSVEFGNFWLSWSGTARGNMMLSVAMPTVCARDLRPGVPKETSLVLSTAEIGGGAGGAAAAASAALSASGGAGGTMVPATPAPAGAPALGSSGQLLPSLLRLEMRAVSSIEDAGNVSGIQLRLQRPTLVLDIGFIMQVGPQHRMGCFWWVPVQRGASGPPGI
jgi:hypothetical protein